ncbi:MAG: peptide-methionine (S)-S-oxide reductase MsrA [Candidatus Nanopelagicales bacterium]
MWSRPTPTMIDPRRALPGRAAYPFAIPDTHLVLGTPLQPPYPGGVVVLGVAMGCFWGAERRMWQLPGLFTTAVGYQGGITSHPTYEEVCTGRTGHAEVVLVAFDPARVRVWDVLRVFWENHDPTSGYRQGNDVGTQYRSALYWETSAQQQAISLSRETYAARLAERGLPEITTEIAPAAELPFYFAEEYHQQYLAKNPRGYDCHANTGIALGARPDGQ